MITVPRMARVLRQVFEIEARELARSMGVIQRERKLNGKTLLLLLVLGWLHHPQAGPSALGVGCSRGEPAPSKSSAAMANKTSTRANMAPASRHANGSGPGGRW